MEALDIINFLNWDPLEVVDLVSHRFCIENKEPIEKVFEKLSSLIDNDFPYQSILKVPSLNVKSVNNLVSGKLARFRCMIQDISDPEMLPAFVKTEQGRSLPVLFRDFIDWPAGGDFLAPESESVIYRHLFRCVPVPCESPWVKREWLKLEENFDLVPKLDTDLVDSSTSDATNEHVKRQIDNVDSTEELNNASDAKRFHSQRANSNIERSQENICTVKVYSDGDAFKLNDVVEFVGIWTKTVNPNDESDALFSLHALRARNLSSVHPDMSQWTKNKICLENVAEVRSNLITYLKQFLMHDSLAAEYLLCNLISSTIRKDLSCLGKFTLNLFNLPTQSHDVVNKLCDALRNVVSKVHYLPLSLDFLNKERFIPCKNYNANSLTTGHLQLSSGTLLIIDETKLTQGHLNEHGLRNFAALKTLITHQKVDYDFVYHSIEFQTDLNILILSEGPSCLSSDYNLPLVEDKEGSTCDTKETDLNTFRQYLLDVRSKDFAVEERVEEKIREDYVDMRRNNSKVNQSKLHELLVLGRWITCSFRKTVLTEECWERTKELECQRQQRLAQYQFR